jgi:hypothetical protein
MITPPGCRIAAERFSCVFRIRRGSRLDIHDAHFEDIARLRAAHKDRSGADVHAESFACPAPEQFAIDRAGAAPVHSLRVFRPMKGDWPGLDIRGNPSTDRPRQADATAGRDRSVLPLRF